jgi:hypothetical protein
VAALLLAAVLGFWGWQWMNAPAFDPLDQHPQRHHGHHEHHHG